ncbi:MAG: capsular biosynthesis protein [Pusillimonas sp.]
MMPILKHTLYILFCSLMAFPHCIQATTVQPSDSFAKTDDGTKYFRFTINEDQLSGAPDFSALNQPINGTGQVFVKGRHFYTVGKDTLPGTEDDQRIRFFGVNLSFAANFPAADKAEAMAKRLRKLGINAVRLHHLDTMPSDETSPPRSVLGSGPYPTFNPEAIHRLRTFIRALAAQGIYVNLNLRVGYRVRPAIDGMPALDKGQTRAASVGTPIHVYYPPLIERQERYARELIRALELERNPALALVEINNESSLLAAWQGDAWFGDSWSNAIPSAYAPTLRRHWEAWIKTHYGSLEAACKAWDRCNDPDVAALPATTISGISSANPSLGERISSRITQLGRDIGLTAGSTDNPSPVQRYTYDFLSFLASMDQAYLDRMHAVIRQATDTPVPITGTQMTYGGIMNLTSHQNMDYIDDHIYVGHHVYANGNPWQSTDWRVQDMTTSGTGMARLLGLSLRRAHNKPFVVSEFNQPFPTPGGSEILPLMVAVASVQDWDGLFLYRYDDSLENKEAPWYFSLSGDWGKYALTAQSAHLFRAFLIPRATTDTPLPLSINDQLFIGTQGHIRTLTLEKHLEQHFGLPLQSAWTNRLSQAVLEKDEPPRVSHTPRGTNQATINPHVQHDEATARVILNTPEAWGLFGKLDTLNPIQSGSFAIRNTTKRDQSVQLLVTPLDRHALTQSRHLLVSLGSDTTGSQPGSIPPRPKGLIPYPGRPGWLTLEPDPLTKVRSAMLSAHPPSWLKRTGIELQLPYTTDQLIIYPLNGSGKRLPALPDNLMRPDPHSGTTWVSLHGSPETASPWYEVVINPDVQTHSRP